MPRKDPLEEEVSRAFGIPLENLRGQGNPQTVISNLINYWTKQDGDLLDLVMQALRRFPAYPKLQSIALVAILREARIPWYDLKLFYRRVIPTGSIMRGSGEPSNLHSLVERLQQLAFDSSEMSWPLFAFCAHVACHARGVLCKAKIKDWMKTIIGDQLERRSAGIDRARRDQETEKIADKNLTVPRVAMGKCPIVSVIVKETGTQHKYGCKILRWEPDGNPREVWSRDPVTWMQIPETIGDALDDLVMRGYDICKTTIEFFLPTELLCAGVDQLELPDPGMPIKLGFDYRVIVRSLERSEKPRSYQRVSEKWNKLKECGSPEEQNKLTKIISVAELLSHPSKYYELRDSHCACLGISLFPQAENKKIESLKMIMGTAIPIVLWLRPGKLGPESEAGGTIGELINGCEVFKLPDAVYSRRRTGTLHSESHHGNRISLMWDDPDRIPPLSDLEFV